MKKGMKKTLKISGIVLVLIIALLILLPIIFKGKILNLVKEEANNNLNALVEFEDIKLTFISSFPHFGLEIEELKVIGKDTFARDTLIAFESFNAGLNVMSVISGTQPEVKTLSLLKPKIHAKVLHNGRANWDIAPADSAAADDESTPEDTSRQDETDTQAYKISLKEFIISDAEIIYDDKSSDVFAHIKNWNFSMSGDLSEEVTDLEISSLMKDLTVISENVKYLNRAEIEFLSELEADLLNSKYTFKDNNFRINEVAIGFDGFVEMPDTNIVTDIKFEAKETAFKSVLSLVPLIYQKDFEGVKTKGTFNFSGYAKGTYNSLNMPAFGIDFNVNKARFQYPDLPGAVENINIALKVDAEEGSGDNMKINMPNAHLEMGGNTVDAKLLADMTAADILFDGEVKGKVNLSKLKDYLHLEEQLSGMITADLNYKGKMSDIDNENYEAVNADGKLIIENFLMKSEDLPKTQIVKSELIFSPQRAELKQFDARIGKSDMQLTGEIDNIVAYALRDDVLSGSFDFSSNYLDLDELAGEEDNETETSEKLSADGETSQNTSSDEAVEIPKNLDFRLLTDIKQISYDGMEITDTKGSLILKNGVALMNKLSLNMLDGKITMSGKFDTQKPEKPKADLQLSISEIDIPKTYDAFLSVQRLAPIAENCTGNVSAQISLNTDLDTELMPIYSSLNSSGNFRSNNIGIKNNKMFSSLAELSKQEVFKNPTLQDIYAEYEIINGKLELKPTDFELGNVDMTIGGTQDLETNIDFDLTMEMPARLAGGFLKNIPGAGNLEDIEITADITGKNTDPKVTNIRSNVTDGVRDKVEEIVDDKVEEIKDDTKEKAEQILKEARQKADALVNQAKKAGDRLIAEAERNGNRLIAEAKNPLTKRAAKKAKEKMVKEAKEKARDLENQAQKQADKIMEEAQEKVDNL